MNYKAIIIDAKNLFRRFLFEIRDEQLRLFKTSDKIGNVIPINHYALVFDTIMRLLIRMNKFVEQTKKVFAKKIDSKTPIYLSTASMSGWFINRLDVRYAKKSLGYKDFQNELYVVISQIYASQDMFNRQVLDYCAYICNQFNLHIPFTRANITIDERNKIVKHFVYLVMLYQTTLTMNEIKYVYEVMCRYSGLKLIQKTTAKTVHDTIFITNSKSIFTYKHCLISDFDFKIVKEEEPTLEKLAIKPHLPIRIGMFKDVCDQSVHQVIRINDDAFMIVINDWKSTYIDLKPLAEAKATSKAKSISCSEYTSLKTVFVKVIDALLIDEQSELKNLF